MYKLDVAYIYPDLLKNEGDISNVIIFKNRCSWRNIDVEITKINPNDNINPNRYDFIFLSGDECKNQLVALQYLKKQADNIKKSIENGTVVLALKGGLQLLGKNIFYGEEEIKCLDIVDFSTKINNERRQGRKNLNVSFLNSKNKILTGYKNHRGMTVPNIPINTFSSSSASTGIIYKNLYGTYFQGDLLAQNYHFADYLISLCMNRKYNISQLDKLDDDIEEKVHKEAVSKG